MIRSLRPVLNACGFLVCCAVHPADGVFINPIHMDGNAVARRIGTAEFPTVGALSSAAGSCTGALIDSNIFRTPDGPVDSWVLTAGHCAELTAPPPGPGPLPADDAVTFRPRGRFVDNDPAMGDIPGVLSNRVRRHTDYAFPNNDISLARLNPADMTQQMALAGAGTSGLLRVAAGTAPAAGTALTAIGLGNANAGGGWGGGLGDKRLFTASVTMQSVGTTNRFEYAQPGSGTNANPTRHICAGDSGGPSFSGAQIMGVHSSTTGEVMDCDGTAVTNRDANVTLPFLYNYIDSYYRRANFWDHLQLLRFPPGGGGPPTLVATDDFQVTAANRGLSVLSPGWELGADTMHPTLGVINGTDPLRYRYFNAIGVANDGMTAELFVDSTSSQGVAELAGMPHVIQKTFMVTPDPAEPVNVCVRVDQRWNSLGVAEDVGLAIPATMGLSWAGLTAATTADLDMWMTRGVCQTLPPGTAAQPVIVKLVTTSVAIPEPSWLFWAWALAFSAARCRQRTC